MSNQKESRVPNPFLVWERPEPEKRPAPVPLSRDRIVRAALALADAEGLAAVSLRKIAALLGSSPMRLYGYIDTKEELLDLLVDAVYGEMIAEGPLEGGWQDALRTMAHRTREAVHRHAWLTELLSGRPHQGPNAMVYNEASLAALSSQRGFEDIAVTLQTLKTVNAYVVGALQDEASERHAIQASGMTKEEWQLATYPYLERMLATGRFPNIARIVKEVEHPSPAEEFERGLQIILDGVAARMNS
ncbi:AcrR family transcriptional regulator [Rhodopseudomonas julia]|uniref:AcrR family transcriptional regulator n=1 Tax=Rhodopseudomonas julia TaxID=200617 RepID=A0ABU0C1Z5_9BRAD|nr:TetR/AcrR family transcriptional regulator [Rhodopseudomonas julia]MDQ0324242.1 AcrR family transcriptional regulator [Rhodopseudomonas julia]